MKRITSILSACMLVIAACDPENAEPDPAVTCAKPHGVYTATSLTSAVTGGAPQCAHLTSGQRVLSELYFDDRGEVPFYDSEITVDAGLAICRTAYADNNCTVEIDCIAVEGDAGARRITILKMNSAGTRFAGTHQLYGYGSMCPSAGGVIGGELVAN